MRANERNLIGALTLLPSFLAILAFGQRRSRSHVVSTAALYPLPSTDLQLKVPDSHPISGFPLSTSTDDTSGGIFDHRKTATVLEGPEGPSTQDAAVFGQKPLVVLCPPATVLRNPESFMITFLVRLAVALLQVQ